MQIPTTSQQTANGSGRNKRLATARRTLAAARPTGPAAVPRRASADQRFIAASLNYQRCAKAYIAITESWQRFSAAHGYDDPGHEDFHHRVIAARQALNGADQALTEAAAKIAKAGEGA